MIVADIGKFLYSLIERFFCLETGLRTKSWTSEGGNRMYTKEQEEIALREYERLGSITAVIRRLGYPSESTLYRWYERKKAGVIFKQETSENSV